VTARSWSRLLDEDPARLDLELARAGTTRKDLIHDVQDVPELRETCRLLRGNKEALLRLALEEFGDRGRPQPEERLAYADHSFGGEPAFTYRTADFGQLSRLDDDKPAETQPTDWRGPFEHATLENVVRLRERGKSYDGIVEELKLSKRQVGYIAKVVDANRIRSGRYGLEGELRSTDDGVYIPKI
jgi:hypothetical protein